MFSFMKNFLNLFKKEKPKNKTTPVVSPKSEANVLPFKKKETAPKASAEDKRVVELLQKKIGDKIKQDPQMQKKAAMILSDMLNKKASGE